MCRDVLVVCYILSYIARPCPLNQSTVYFKEPLRATGDARLVLPEGLNRGPTSRSLRPVASSQVALTRTFYSSNGFLAACHVAYSLHLPLRLRPDDVWMPIIASVAQFVDSNASSLRESFVDFPSGSAELVVLVPPSFELLGDSRVPWGDVVHTFNALIAEHTHGDVREAFTPQFSTTDAISIANSGIVLMAALKSYFSYSMVTLCGIREVVLEGTPEDWEQLRTRAAGLGSLARGRLGAELPEWFSLLDATLAQLVATARGTPSADFWSRIFSSHTPHESGAKTLFSGWALNFFLYDKRGTRINHTTFQRNAGKVRDVMFRGWKRG